MNTPTGFDFRPPQYAKVVARGRRMRVLRNVGALLGVVLLLTGAWIGAGRWLNGCSSGMWRGVDDECVGVSDGSASLHPGLGDIEEKIERENDRIAGIGGKVVTVAVLTPVPEPGGERASVSLEQVRSKIIGAYLAQRKTNLVEGAYPLIRLVIADEGSNEKSWQPVVEKLIGLTEDEQPLVAVTGLGVSIGETIDAAHLLARHDIPMVGAVLTADGLNMTGAVRSERGPIRGLYRVSPSNHTEVLALHEHLATQQRKYMLVRDQNFNDFYTTGLRDDFAEVFSAELESSGVQRSFDGTPGINGTTNQFNEIGNELCSPGTPDTVLYAGRASLLDAFVEKLRDRYCQKQITVVTGSDAAKLANTELPQNVDVIYAALADPKALGDKRFNVYAEDYRANFDAYRQREGIDSRDLGNGWAIMEFDAMTAVVLAAQNALRGETEIGPAEVRTSLVGLTSERSAVTGAGDKFYFNADTGDPVGRTIHVIHRFGNESEPVDKYTS
ncbi:ABC transporter substrate-binding protein [Saccharopolyspora gloriosae]|uniref:ABC transporter substrate-binding protein n=1 Tax=Saccharopolyspora gloriosae TaxID=455344 RepID=UPI001FB700DF|nr:ABC transporter substrate-binding protein [Saccharopolyspora gloriosae]